MLSTRIALIVAAVVLFALAGLGVQSARYPLSLRDLAFACLTASLLA